jgi:hypothetical protein
LINIAVSIIILLFLGGDKFFFVFASFGYITSILHKEIYKKNEYLFYSNNGISKIKLLTFSYVFTLFFVVFGAVMLFLLKKIF